MRYYHEKLGLAAFVLSILGVFTVGLLVIPALICASLSKRAADRAGVSRDGFATAANVVSGCVLALWGIIILGLVALMGMKESGASGLNRPPVELGVTTEVISSDIRVGIMIVAGAAIACLLAAMIGKQLAYARGRRVRRLMGRR